jgi:hypothetical protein
MKRRLVGILNLKVEGLYSISIITLKAINPHITVWTSTGNDPSDNVDLSNAPNPKK